MKKLLLVTAVIGMVLLIFSQVSFGQIVERSIWKQSFISREYRPRYYYPYENFGSYDLRRYPPGVDPASSSPVTRGPVTPVSYDQFGNFLLPGGEIYSMSWNRSRIGASEWQDNQWANNVFNNLMISSDEIANWQTRFIIASGGTGMGVRTYFTPSTLKQTNFGGFRWDASSRKNNVSLVASAGSIPLYGLHWESKLGDIMNIGATFVSRQRGTISYSHQDIDRELQGEPRYVYVVITDDSPEDTGPGARVFGLKAFINGKQEPIAFHGEKGYAVRGRVFKITDLFQRKRYYEDDFQKQYIFNYPSNRAFLHRDVSQDRNSRGSWLLPLLDRRILDDLFHKSGEAGSVGYLSLVDADKWDPDDPNDKLRLFKADLSEGYLEAKNSDVIIYEILVPHGTRNLEFNVNVANDYCIDIIAALYSFRQESEAGWYDEPLTDAWRGNWSIKEYDTKHCVKAPGNVKDGSNQKWVKVRYDRMTGMNVYGMNMEFNWRGLFIRAEYNENNTHWSYPLAEKLTGGKRSKYTSRAWFVNAEKVFEYGQNGQWSIGAELFDYPNEYMQYWAPIDDNDDDDRYTGGSEYPGLDADFDRMIDTTWRDEPYLNYFYDEIIVGDDFDHNGGIDMRENDSQIDLPYDRDSRGQHYFLKLRPREATIISLGHYDIRQTYHNGRNFTRYLKFEHHQRLRGIGEFLFYNRTERIKDDYNLDQGNHNLINNWDTTNILSTRLNFIPDTNIINNARFDTSYQVGDMRRTDGTEEEIIQNFLGIYYDDKRIKRYGGYSYSLEHKADYTFRLADARILPEVTLWGFRLWREKRIKELKFMPMMKVVHSYSYSRQNNYALNKYDRRTRSLHTYPIVRLDYRVAPKTQLRFGIQGFPGFEERYRVRSSRYGKLFDYNQRRMVLAFENRSLYQGFNLLVMAGMRFSRTKYINDLSKKDPGATEYFITLQSEASQ